MKLMPLTSQTRAQLSQEGFTHVILKSIIPAADREYPTGRELCRELYLYEAVKSTDNKLRTCLSDELDSERINELLKKENSDFYISVR
jgi:hypothetical protein